MAAHDHRRLIAMNTSTSDRATTVLITGGNKGLGYETARRLGTLGWQVFLGSRDEQRGSEAADKLAAEGIEVTMINIDVTSDGSVAEAVRAVEQCTDRLDVLINNAGLMQRTTSPAETKAQDFLSVYGVNVLGPVRVTQAFLPLLRAAADPRVVMVSSGMGSLALTNDPNRIESTIVGLVYPSSKSALNMITSQYARGIPEIRFNAVDPGYTATDLNHHQGAQTVAEGTDAIVRMATAGPAGPTGPTGTFTDRHGSVSW
jgi:NAD(P)-dependent dehydrogenase (short-subunit alcohol dehydrogenase family)